MKSWRLVTLMGLGAIAWLTLGRTLFFAPPYREIHLPLRVGLPGWQFEGAEFKTSREADQPDARLAWGDYHYRSPQGSQPLKVEVSYLLNTQGDVLGLIGQYRTLKPTVVVWRQQQGGEYILFANQNRAYLSTCLNPRGGSTVTAQQFRRNRNTYDVTLARLLPWLLGQSDLRDWRCLWLTLSMPIESTPEMAYQHLETAWKELSPLWQAQFNQL